MTGAVNGQVSPTIGTNDSAGQLRAHCTVKS